jgi:hypothetical protein
MKTSILAVSLLTFAAGAAFADKVRDWHDLDEVHTHIVESIHEMERAGAANHYDMAGHGAKAEQLLRRADVNCMKRWRRPGRRSRAGARERAGPHRLGPARLDAR